MTKVIVHSEASVPEAAKARLAEVKKAWGFIRSLHGTLAESPIALDAYDTLSRLVAKSSFTPAEQQAAYLAVNELNECGYCTAGHNHLARAAKLNEAAIQARRNSQPIADARLEALRGFVGDAAVDALHALTEAV